jgi:hypothetical protein
LLVAKFICSWAWKYQESPDSYAQLASPRAGTTNKESLGGNERLRSGKGLSWKPAELLNH